MDQSVQRCGRDDQREGQVHAQYCRAGIERAYIAQHARTEANCIKAFAVSTQRDLVRGSAVDVLPGNGRDKPLRTALKIMQADQVFERG